MTIANGNTKEKAVALDVVTSRHEQALGILSMIIVELADAATCERTLRKTLASTLWAVETLIQQASEATATI